MCYYDFTINHTELSMFFSKRRNRGGCGHNSNTITVYGFNEIMQRMIDKFPDVKQPVKKPAAKKKVILTDEQVIECRTRYEFEGWSRRRLLDEYEKYGVTNQYLYNLLSYATRSKLIPKRPEKPCQS